MGRFEGRYLSGRPSDKRYDSAGAAEFFRCFFESGVIALEDNLRVEAAGAQSAYIHPGKALLDGYLVKIIATEEEPYLISAPEDGKWGRVVLRAQKSGPGLYVKEGTSEEPPALERGNGVYEISLARICCGQGGMIVVDERAEKALCGVCGFQSSMMLSLAELIHSSKYDIGDIVFRDDDINPGTLYGGTWELIWQGKTPVGLDPDDPDFSEVGKTGGSKTVSYALGNSGYAKIDATATNPATLKYARKSVDSYATQFVMTGGQGATMTTGDSTTSRAVVLGGTTEEGSNMQPFAVCRIWKRVA